jgi:hypothetical protein
MRRLLVILLVLVLPLKALASVVALPTGSSHASAPDAHHHAVDATHAAGTDLAAGGSSCCDVGDGAALTHECPHLAMPLLAPSPAITAVDRDRGTGPLAPARPFVSVVLDVLHPPPLRRSPALRG